MDWVVSRTREPSSWAAVSAAVVGIGVLISWPAVVLGGVRIGALGVLLKEKGVI